MSNHIDRIRREVKAINELNKTNTTLRFILVLNISATFLFSYVFFVNNNILHMLFALMVASINALLLVNTYE